MPLVLLATETPSADVGHWIALGLAAALLVLPILGLLWKIAAGLTTNFVTINHKLDTQGKSIGELKPMVQEHHDLFTKLKDRGFFEPQPPYRASGTIPGGNTRRLAAVKITDEDGE